MAEHRTEAARWREVDGWRASGESVDKYAARRGYSATTLRKWISMADAPTMGPGLVRVVSNSTVSAEPGIVVEVGAARIRVTGEFDGALLRSVVVALSERSR